MEYTVKILEDRTETHFEGLLHSINDQPAVVYNYGTKHWFKNGKLHRDNGPAIERADGEKRWCKDGKLHRDDDPELGPMPAIEYADGLRHRIGGPAYEYDGRKSWWVDGKRHRDNITTADGKSIPMPAVELAGTKRYYKDGVEFFPSADANSTELANPTELAKLTNDELKVELGKLQALVKSLLDRV